MAITFIKTPQQYVPVYNPVEFYFSSDEYAQPNFKFYITVSIDGTPIVSFTKELIDTDKGYVDVSEIAQKYIDNYYPFGEYGWKNVTDGIKILTLDVDEQYSGSIHTGDSYGVKVFNAALKQSERAIYAIDDYVVINTRNNIWLNKNPVNPIKLKWNQDYVFYFLTGAGDWQVQSVDITAYGTSPTTAFSRIYNSFYPASSNAERFVCINLGLSGLAQIASGDVIGDYPIVNTSTTSYIITFTSEFSGSTQTHAINVEVDNCEAKFEQIPVFYLNRFGAYDCYNFYGNDTESLRVNKEYFKPVREIFQGSYNVVSSGANPLGANPQQNRDVVLSSTYNMSRNLKSQYLSDSEIENLQDLITSPEIFIQTGLNAYEKYKCEDLSYQFRNKGEKQQYLELNLTNGITEVRQSGR